MIHKTRILPCLQLPVYTSNHASRPAAHQDQCQAPWSQEGMCQVPSLEAVRGTSRELDRCRLRPIAERVTHTVVPPVMLTGSSWAVWGQEGSLGCERNPRGARATEGFSAGMADPVCASSILLENAMKGRPHFMIIVKKMTKE